MTFLLACIVLFYYRYNLISSKFVTIDILKSFTFAENDYLFVLRNAVELK